MEIAERARKEGYIVASPTIASDDMLERVIERIQSESEKTLGFSAGLQFTRDEEERKSFTYKITKLIEAINNAGKGVVILIDEIQANSPGMKQMIISYQELVGMGADVAIAFAGLQGAISSVLNKGDIDSYYLHAFKDMEIIISDSLRKKAVDATDGYPMADLSKRMVVSSEYVQRYKKRLIDSGIIRQMRRGEVAFAVPHLADYLRGNN